MKKAIVLWAMGAMATLGCGDASAPPSAVAETRGGLAGEDLDQILPIPPVPVCTVDSKRELLIVDDSVRLDPWATGTGPWSFAHLVSQMAPAGQDPSAFVLAWLESWAAASSINGFPVSSASRLRDEVICPWAARSGTPCDGKGKVHLDLSQAPFQLIAVVNRVDLRRGGYAAADAGEGRFVFNVLSASGGPLSFTVIFEYGLPTSNGQNALSWAKAWHALSEAPDADSFGPMYRAALRAITDGFTARNASPGRPNGSALNQVRSNEIGIALDWNLREFHLSGRNGALLQGVTKETPHLATFNALPRAAELRADLEAHRQEVLDGAYHVPAAWLGGEALEIARWNPADLGSTDEALRHAFALNTCDGCHTRETNTGFTHLRASGSSVSISPWLATVDLPRRVLDMEGIVCGDPAFIDARTEKTKAPSARPH